MNYFKLIVLFILTSCFLNKPDRYLSKDELIAKKITIEVAKQLQKEKGFSFSGFGGRGDGDIELMMMSVHTIQPFDISKGRALIIECIDIYLSAINNNIEIRPYLHNYPFTYKNIQIEIYKPVGAKFSEIACVSIEKGKIIYYVDNGKSFDIAYEESYETALKKLQEEKKNAEVLQP